MRNQNPVRRLFRFARALALGLALMALPRSASPQAPNVAGDDERLTVIHAGKIITVSGAEIENGVIVLSGSKIRSVGPTPDYPRNARVIDARGLTVMPGLINPHTRFAMGRYNRTGVHGDFAAIDEIRIDESTFEDLMEAGYTAVALSPGGTGIPGRASIVRTGGAAAARVIESPAYLKLAAEKSVLRAALTKAQAEIDKVEKARKEFDDKLKAASQPASAPATASASAPASQPASAPASAPVFQSPATDPKHQVLMDLLQKKPSPTLVVEVGGASDILQIEELFKKPGVAPAWIMRNFVGSDFHRVVDHLGQTKARVVVFPLINRMPNSAERIHLVRDLSRAGAEVSLMSTVDISPEEHQRVLPRAAELVREGWSRGDALKSVTLNPARLLGIQQRFGTIEEGREADLVFFDGDPLSGLAEVERVMIAGELVYDARKERH